MEPVHSSRLGHKKKRRTPRMNSVGLFPVWNHFFLCKCKRWWDSQFSNSHSIFFQKLHIKNAFIFSLFLLYALPPSLNGFYITFSTLSPHTISITFTLTNFFFLFPLTLSLSLQRISIHLFHFQGLHHLSSPAFF